MVFEGSFENPNSSFQLQLNALLDSILLLLSLKLTELVLHGTSKIVERSRVVLLSHKKSLVFMVALEGKPSALHLLCQPYLSLVVFSHLSCPYGYGIVHHRSYPIRLSSVHFLFFLVLVDVLQVGLSCEFLLFFVVF